MRTLQRKEYALHDFAQRALSVLNDLTSQAIASIKLQKITVTEGLWFKKIDEASSQYRAARGKVISVTLLFYLLMGIAPVLCYGIFFYLGLDKVYSGTISVGEFIAFQTYILVLQGPLAELGTVLSDFQRGFASLERIAEVLRTPADPKLLPSPSLVSPPNESEKTLELKNITIGVGSRALVKSLSLTIHEGEWIGIMGPIGSGKSLLLQVCAGLMEPQSGEVILNGKSLSSYDHHELRKHLALVPQRPFLFADTIRNNIALDLPLEDADLWDLLKCVNIDEEIRSVPGNLDAVLGEWGINLSGGQKQRLTLARTLARNPELLFLDDCLSAVDAHTEEKILEALKERLKGKTVLWVAHRASTLRFCTKVFSMEELTREH